MFSINILELLWCSFKKNLNRSNNEERTSFPNRISNRTLPQDRVYPPNHLTRRYPLHSWVYNCLKHFG